MEGYIMDKKAISGWTWNDHEFNPGKSYGESNFGRVPNEKHMYKVAERFVAAIDESAKPPFQMGFFIDYNIDDILRQATESTLRYQRGEPISVLDGVPVAIKDEIDCLPYPTTGTKWMHKERPCKDDACCVKRLRQCGAILVGKSNMHELGSGTSGINPHYGKILVAFVRLSLTSPA
ncbi:fatty acid amide hydrolase-like isoform X2 [Vicia villosa]|uniref:fatty acid amide hydrolase-like isoform X2 n=1 Tax=Vicia villosa TaxID=3911 RepID=UPI00273C5A12|nr:fatty acid amide hydrolase-like isoform X2 [Vicia villosa]